MIQRCCHIVASVELKYGGPSKSVYALSRAFARWGTSVDLLTTSPGRLWERKEALLNIETFHRDTPQSICRSVGLWKHLQGLDADVIHHHGLWLRTLHYAHEYAVARKIPLIVSPRGMMSEWAWHRHPWRKKFARRYIHPGALEAVSGWHATSEAEAAEIRSLGFEQPICVAPNGVEFPRERDDEISSRHWREHCPETNSYNVAIFFGRFHSKKRVLELIDLWVARGSEEWLLLMVGIPDEYSVEQLERRVRSARGRGRVRVFDGSRRPPPYGIASLFLLPSHSENFGLAIAEAMSHGVPVVVTDTTPWQELNARFAGWCVPWESYNAALDEACALSMTQLMDRGSTGRRYVIRNFSWDGPVGKLSVFYETLRLRQRERAVETGRQ